MIFLHLEGIPQQLGTLDFLLRTLKAPWLLLRHLVVGKYFFPLRKLVGSLVADVLKSHSNAHSTQASEIQNSFL